MKGLRVVGESKIVEEATYIKKQEAKIKKDKKRNMDPRLQNLNVRPWILNQFIK
ncbi:hypothetical protein FIU87_07140 [Bacillus sp. THAF10]|uniref:hypothetical protein n=1 Tax=Bacillus sp. THAF10 TaxID=2587848 RepID=UPI0012A92DB4|nr:hypothetical protein [Bacillus sp. THAF10]QFT88413.1 hypothetical protein FIU87_07140 [Bacillus sp. THAF10]